MAHVSILRPGTDCEMSLLEPRMGIQPQLTQITNTLIDSLRVQNILDNFTLITQNQMPIDYQTHMQMPMNQKTWLIGAENHLGCIKICLSILLAYYYGTYDVNSM